MMSYQQHRERAKAIQARCAVITLSDTRTVDDDASGRRIAELLEAEGHLTTFRQIIPDDAEVLRAILDELLGRADVDAIITSGGTGISRRDQTVGVIEGAIESLLPGFGELFRMLSWDQVGSGAMLSRAIGGIARGKPLFSLPGSTAAVELAMTKLILPELRHLLFELRK
jgi:molybdenum cofactor biosynthesis protein B